MRRKDTTTEMMRGYVAEALLRLLDGCELHQVAVKRLASEAGVSRSTFYRLFDGKEAVLSWWYGSLMDEYVRAFAAGEDHGREGYLASIFQTFSAHKSELLLFHRRGCTPLLLKLMRGRLTGESPSYASAYHVGGVCAVMEMWMERGMSDSASHMTLEALAIMPRGFIPAAVERLRS